MNHKRNRAYLLMVLPGMVLAGAVAADEFEITRSTIDGGGMMWITGGGFELCGTIGQPDAGPGAQGMSGGDLTLTGGFWFPLTAGDGNMDGGVDLIDYHDLEVCLSGPESGAPPSECRSFDTDGDDDIDLSDVARFQRSFTGH